MYISDNNYWYPVLIRNSHMALTNWDSLVLIERLMIEVRGIVQAEFRFQRALTIVRAAQLTVRADHAPPIINNRDESRFAWWGWCYCCCGYCCWVSLDLWVFLECLFLISLHWFCLFENLAILCIVTFHPKVIVGDLSYVFFFRVFLNLVLAILNKESLPRFEYLLLPELFLIVFFNSIKRSRR